MKKFIPAVLSLTGALLMGQSSISEPSSRDRAYQEIPVLNDGQQFSPLMEIAATSGMKTPQRTVITLESEWSWCAGSYFSPNIPTCFKILEKEGQRIGKSVRTTWEFDCEKSTIQEKSRLVADRKIVYSLNGGNGKGTQRPWRVYSYACQGQNSQ